MAIEEFRGMYGFLSNMHACPVVVEGISYKSSEAAYQAMKTEDLAERLKISKMSGPESKRYARTIPIRNDWDEIKLSCMENILRAKFSQNPALKTLLLYTIGEELVEKNSWGDTFWGVCKNTGENHLGKLLMKLRNEYAEEV